MLERGCRFENKANQPAKKHYMNPDVKFWTYKSKAELEALKTDELLKIYNDVKESIKFLKRIGNDEIFWLWVVVPQVLKERGVA